ncbi:ABC transporter permease [Rothia sp. (in: high G+C Gram-positive bacteria)]|uniref:ABC transporter permease n=1 Tax=Rothia sp. (in: high G+C Gram-positive bacteria) TaxID=1885016 RepID=UPI000EBCB0F0|nr:ABC transporter permease [Rothia sp. (in: high G+C Gram-positive bacteria)]
MSVVATQNTKVSAETETGVVKNWKNPVIYTVLALLSVFLIGVRAPEKTISLGISDGVRWFQAEPLQINPQVYGWIAVAIMLALAAYALVTTNTGKLLGRWVAPLFWLTFVTGLLVWAIGSTAKPSLSLVSLLTGAVALSIPMIFGSMGGLLCERSGIVNIAIEGQLLFGAFSAVLVGSLTGSPWAGLLAAMAGGVLVSSILALFSIKYLVDQVIVGVVVNVLVSGLTGFLFARVLQPNAPTLNSAPKLPSFEIPVLSQIPVIGPVLFDQNVLVYLMYFVVGLIWFALNKTKWGLRTRAVGEHPKAADTLGVNVNRLRLMNVLLAGAVAGMGGAFFTLVSVSAFNSDMTAGQGYIALAALIFGRWTPVGALSAALLFGFSLNLQFVLSILGTQVPTELLAMLPYLVTIFAVAGLVGRSRGPAAVGTPYVKE